MSSIEYDINTLDQAVEIFTSANKDNELFKISSNKSDKAILVQFSQFCGRQKYKFIMNPELTFKNSEILTILKSILNE